LPSDSTVFLFTFDTNSSVARKNPMGVVEAFTRAFPRRSPDSPVLVIKTINLEREPEFEKILRNGVAEVGGVLMTSHMSDQQMADLFNTSDVYISLHRSEGFGLGMAEAMAIGKPVIGTGYSGNIDFMNSANSCLVGYNLRSIVETDHVYNSGASSLFAKGSVWAEPNLDQAVEWIRLLALNEHLRYRIGEHARQTINDHFSENAASSVALSRLATLNAELRTHQSPTMMSNGRSR
jgi:glycosyltransferase involved in cell wall biosynthesis